MNIEVIRGSVQCRQCSLPPSVFTKSDSGEHRDSAGVNQHVQAEKSPADSGAAITPVSRVKEKKWGNLPALPAPHITTVTRACPFCPPPGSIVLIHPQITD